MFSRYYFPVTNGEVLFNPIPRHEPTINPEEWPDWTWYWKSGPKRSDYPTISDPGSSIVHGSFEPIEDEL